MAAGWSISDAIDEVHMHVEVMRLIIKGVEHTKKPDTDILRTMNYALGVMRGHRANLHHVEAALDRSNPDR